MHTTFDKRDTRSRVQRAAPIAVQQAAQVAEQETPLFPNSTGHPYVEPDLDWDDEDTLPGCVIEGFAPGTFR